MACALGRLAAKHRILTTRSQGMKMQFSVDAKMDGMDLTASLRSVQDWAICCIRKIRMVCAATVVETVMGSTATEPSSRVVATTMDLAHAIPTTTMALMASAST